MVRTLNNKGDNTFGDLTLTDNGIRVERSGAVDATVVWNETRDVWQAGLESSESDIALWNGTSYTGSSTQQYVPMSNTSGKLATMSDIYINPTDETSVSGTTQYGSLNVPILNCSDIAMQYATGNKLVYTDGFNVLTTNANISCDGASISVDQIQLDGSTITSTSGTLNLTTTSVNDTIVIGDSGLRITNEPTRIILDTAGDTKSFIIGNTNNSGVSTVIGGNSSGERVAFFHDGSMSISASSNTAKLYILNEQSKDCIRIQDAPDTDSTLFRIDERGWIGINFAAGDTLPNSFSYKSLGNSIAGDNIISFDVTTPSGAGNIPISMGLRSSLGGSANFCLTSGTSSGFCLRSTANNLKGFFSTSSNFPINHNTTITNTWMNVNNSSEVNFPVDVSIGSDGSFPVASAILDITSTTKGVLLPRLTAGQIVTLSGSSPATGLLVYSTDDASLCVFNGSSFGVIAHNGNSRNYLRNLEVDSICTGSGPINTMCIADFSSTTSKSVRLPNIADPSASITSPLKGMMCFNSTTNKFVGYNGTSWVDFH